MSELVPGVVEIYELKKLFEGVPSSSVKHVHHAQGGHHGRVETIVKLSGHVRSYPHLEKLLQLVNLSREFPGNIDGMHFLFWVKDVSRWNDEFIDPRGLAPTYEVTFYARRVAPTIHPVEEYRRRKRARAQG